jgi:fructose-specific component phosphotransferase system IIB-like protein
MHRPALTLMTAALLGLGMCAPAFAADNSTPTTHYRWTDASGVVHFGDTIPSAALAGGYDIVNDQGRVVRHVAPELTPAARRAAAATAARDAAVQRAARQRQIEDTQMLAAYPTAHDLDQSQQAQLQQIQSDIETLETNLRSQEDSLTELLAHAADIEHSGKPVPPDVNKRIADQRRIVNDERNALIQRRADYANSKAKFAARLDHYRALRAKFQTEDDPPQ